MFDYVINFVKPLDICSTLRGAKWQFKPQHLGLSVYNPYRGY